MKNTKHYSAIKILQNNLFSIRFLWGYSKPYFFFSLLQIFIRGIEAPVTLLLTSRLFTMLESGCSFSYALFLTLAVLLTKITAGAWGQLFDTYITPVYREKLSYQIQVSMFDKVRNIGLEKYDDPDFYNDFILSMQFTDSYFLTAINNLSALLGNALMFVSIFGIFIDIDAFTCAVILLSSCISAVLGNKLKKAEYNEQIAFADNLRTDDYIERTFKLADFSKELRMTEYKECLYNKYDEATNNFKRLVSIFGKIELRWETCIFLNKQVSYAIILVTLLYKLAVTGTISLGDFTVVVNAYLRFSSSLSQLSELVTQLPTQSKKIDMVRSFIESEQEEKTKLKDIPDFESLEFKNVSFGYTSQEEVLHNVSLTIRKNEKMAIVGYNGAGKSTFVKLLMGLYPPTSGTILYNGLDISLFDPECYRKKMSAVFQDFKIFSASLAENILADEFTPEKENVVWTALENIKFSNEVKKWDNGIKTVLTKEFDKEGRNLSGGESQKVAIARAFAADGEIIILDEPSSALDPVAENEIYLCIKNRMKEKTVIFISHRLSSTVAAHKIYMFEDGNVIESGTHQDLIAQNGKYAELFKIQAEKYAI